MIYEDEDILFNISRPDLILPNQNESLMDFEISSLPPPPTNEELTEMETNGKSSEQGKYLEI